MNVLFIAESDQSIDCTGQKYPSNSGRIASATIVATRVRRGLIIYLFSGERNEISNEMSNEISSGWSERPGGNFRATTRDHRAVSERERSSGREERQCDGGCATAEAACVGSAVSRRGVAPRLCDNQYSVPSPATPVLLAALLSARSLTRSVSPRPPSPSRGFACRFVSLCRVSPMRLTHIDSAR
ncbi:hypothetical protein PUN28_001514 [Cardiocondyla obscurior]|uniref:Uncharacterized protein n=1 Tax=Cardiocondyla obscurior TaxID=286306 RepID=A0AAW2H5E3_9HYME